MEVQLTDFENAAHSVFIVLLTRAIMNLGLNFYIPISKVHYRSALSCRCRLSATTMTILLFGSFPFFHQVDENMHRAHRRDAVNNQKFFFRKDLYSPRPGHACDTSPTPSPTAAGPSPLSAFINANGSATNHASPSVCSSHAGSRAASPELSEPLGPIDEEYGEFTINEIINGDGKDFPGLMGVVKVYLDSLKMDIATRKELDNSLELIRRRADGMSILLSLFRTIFFFVSLTYNAPFDTFVGSLITTATWMRNFVRSHPAYKFDSVVSQEINYDLIRAVDEIERGERSAFDLLPQCYKGSNISDGDAFKNCCDDVMNSGIRI